MPSACIKVEKVDNNMSVETSDPLKQVLNLIDKKIRNLEKRKVCNCTFLICIYVNVNESTF